jgi:cell division protein FtsQ
MSFKSKIGKIVFISFWVAAAAGIMVLLVAAIRDRKEQTCEGYTIEIKGSGQQWFIDKKDVADILTGNGGIQLKGKLLKSINLASLEERLEKNPWVKDAQLYFDNNQVLQVRIEERTPIARLFATNGSSFYIDSSGSILPLSDKMSTRLPVFTGYPLLGSNLKKHEDSVLVEQVKWISQYLLRDPFWMAQVEQVDITPSRTFDMVPSVGNHIIEFGDGNDYEKKFKRLLAFYQQVLSKAGMDTYEKVKVQFDKEVIGIKKEKPVSKADSLQAVRNVLRMIDESEKQAMQADSLGVQN